MHLFITFTLLAKGAVRQLATLVGHEVASLGEGQVVQVQQLSGCHALRGIEGGGENQNNMNMVKASMASLSGGKTRRLVPQHDVIVIHLSMLDVHRLHVINPRLPHPLPARSLLLKTHDNVNKQKPAQCNELLKTRIKTTFKN